MPIATPIATGSTSPERARDLDRAILCLAGGPFLLRGETRIELPAGGRRLLALVALRGGLDRRIAAGTLWPESCEERASGNLRSALWRMRSTQFALVEARGSRLLLRTGITVDVTSALAWADRVIDGRFSAADLQMSPARIQALDLLPGWYDDWVVFEREHLRQRLFHALETLTRHLVDEQRWSEALETAMAVVNMEPLRESAQRTLAEVHLAEGNVVEARRTVDTYRGLARAELGVDASEGLIGLVPERRDW